MAPTLRQRNAKIAPVNGYSFKRGKKVENLSAVKKKTIDKKKKKLVKISDDVLFDMLRLFTRRELHAFKLVNRRMKRVVELGDQKKQLRQQFVLAKIDFSSWPTAHIRNAAIIRANRWMARKANKNISDENKQLLQNVLAKNLKLLSPATNRCGAKVFIYIFLTDDEVTSTTPAYIVKLQHHPKTIKDLRRIHFWLRELSRVHITSARIFHFLNPALVEALFPNEDIFLSIGDLEILTLLNNMLPSIAALFQIGVLRCAPVHLSDGVNTLFNEFLLTSKHGVNTIYFFSHSFVTMRMADIYKIIDEFEYAKLKRLPSKMQLCNMYESLENDPTLKHIETTDETEKYELVRNSESMKIFLVRTREQNFPNWKPVTLTINLIDQGR